jgi:hypothetical protein
LLENALKLAYGNIKFQNFPGRTPGLPAPRGGKVREGRVEESRGRGREGMRRLEGKGWKGRAKGKGREGKRRKGRKGRGEEFGPPMFQTDRRHWQDI